MTEIDYSINLADDPDTLDLEDNGIPSGQKIRTEDQIAEDGIKDFRRISQIRYPLLTMVEVLKYNANLGKIPPFIQVNFSGNLGDKENKEAMKNTIDDLFKRDGLELADAVHNTLKQRITELNERLNQSVKNNIQMISVETQAGGLARSKLLEETRKINEDFTKRLRLFVQSLKPDHKNHKKPYKKPDEKKRPSNANKELSKLMKKFGKK